MIEFSRQTLVRIKIYIPAKAEAERFGREFSKWFYGTYGSAQLIKFTQKQNCFTIEVMPERAETVEKWLDEYN